MFQTKFDEKSWNFKFIALPAKLDQSKNRQGDIVPTPLPGQLGLILWSNFVFVRNTWY